MTFPDDYLKWRNWAAIFGPTVLAFGTAYVLGETLLGTLLALAFCLTVGLSFTRYMARSQTLFDYRDKLQRLQAEYNDVAELVEALPVEERSRYVESLHLMDMRIRVLQSVLESKQ